MADTRPWVATGPQRSECHGRVMARVWDARHGTGRPALGDSVASFGSSSVSVDRGKSAAGARVATTPFGTLHRDVTDTRPGDEGRPDPVPARRRDPRPVPRVLRGARPHARAQR